MICISKTQLCEELCAGNETQTLGEARQCRCPDHHIVSAVKSDDTRQFSNSNSNVFAKAPYFDGFDALNQRSGWPPLVVTHPSTSHHLWCVQCGSVCMRVLLCLVFIIAVCLGNEVIFYQLNFT